MKEDNPSIYQQLQRPTAQLIEMLMSSNGQAMLDKEILQMKDEMGEQSFDEFAQQFFKDTNINYKTFFSKGEKQSHDLRVIPAIKKQINVDEQIIETNHPRKDDKDNKDNKDNRDKKTFLITSYKEKQIQNKIQQQMEVVQNYPEDCTNISQEIDNQYEEMSKQNLDNNRFRIKYKNGDIYEGEMQEGMKNGWGDYLYQSGEKYSGCFIDDQINGYGRYYFLSGAEYEGDWSSGMKHGIGILKFANKDVYEGSFSNDDLHGKGLYRYQNGDVFQGIFKKGLRNGLGVFTGADGRFQKGQWINDKFEI